MTMPRRANTKPILAAEGASRMAQGSVMVMPIPTAEPLRAAMVGLRHCWISRATRPPLEFEMAHVSRCWVVVVVMHGILSLRAK